MELLESYQDTIGPTRIPVVAVQWISELLMRIVGELLGRWPVNDRDWEMVSKRIGLKVCYVPHTLVASPLMKYDFGLQRGHVAIPQVTDRHQRCRWLFHEVIEVLLGLEHYHPPIIYPVEWGNDHDIARAVEELFFGPRLQF